MGFVVSLTWQAQYLESSVLPLRVLRGCSSRSPRFKLLTAPKLETIRVGPEDRSLVFSGLRSRDWKESKPEPKPKFAYLKKSVRLNRVVLQKLAVR